MDDLISRKALLKKARWMEEPDNDGIPVDIKAVSVDAIEDTPSVEAEAVKHSQWIPTECGTMCSACHRVYDNDFEIRRSVCIELKICPDCGAKMDGGVTDAQ